eukprot:gene5621-4040_t
MCPTDTVFRRDTHWAGDQGVLCVTLSSPHSLTFFTAPSPSPPPPS